MKGLFQSDSVNVISLENSSNRWSLNKRSLAFFSKTFF